MPQWLHAMSWISIAISAASFLIIVADVLLGHRQQMWIMNVVWPVTALFAGPLALYAYFTVGRLSTHHAVAAAKARGEENPGKKKPFWQSVGIGATHCGSGCALGDLLAEWLTFFLPVVIFGKAIFGIVRSLRAMTTV